MPLNPTVPPVPADTARVAKYPVRDGNLYRSVGDRLCLLLSDLRFDDVYPDFEPPLPAPMLALITVFQYNEGLSDVQAVAAVRRRIDWKYALHLPLSYAGFEQQILQDFRERVLSSRSAKQEFDRLLLRLREVGLGSRVAVSAFYVLTSVRTLNRLLLLRRTMCLALEAIAANQPDWLRSVARSHWLERYSRTQSSFRPPQDPEKGETLAVSIGADGDQLLRALGRADAPRLLTRLPEVDLLRHVWQWQFEKRPAAPSAHRAAARPPAQGIELPLHSH